MKINRLYVGLGVAAIVAVIALANQAGLRNAIAQEAEQPAIQTQEQQQLQTEQQLRTGQDQIRHLDERELEATEHEHETIKASQLLNMNVRVRGDDRNVGRIDDLVLSYDGEVQYVAVSHGGFLGIGDRLIAVPMDALEIVQKEPGVFVDPSYAQLDITEEQLRQMEGFDRTADWPTRTDRMFGDRQRERHVERPERHPDATR